MQHFENFKMTVYCTAQTLSEMDEDRLLQEWNYLEKYVGIDKVYLETFRYSTTVEKKQMSWIKDFFLSRGVEVSGGITTVTPDLSKQDEKRHRLLKSFCYSNEKMRNHLLKIVEYTASMFDEFLLDDFFFTACTCEDCIKEKGSRSWSQFRADKMVEVSENLIVGPAKKVNPNVRVIIKYPNWRESYHYTGYCPERQRDVFDFIYTGTETRNTALTDQHLPRYLSYSLMRYMENVAPNRNGGGWFDTYQCWPIECYLEQAYLTALSRPREIMLFQWGDLYENKLVTPLNVQLSKIDRILSRAGKPTGTHVYLPFDSNGENNLESHLGMQGIPFEAVSYFPESAPCVLLTKAALKDDNIADKLERYVFNGGTAIVTTGFLAGLLETTRDRLHLPKLTGRKLLTNRYQVTDDATGYYTAKKAILFDELEFGNNASWSYLNAGSGDSHSSILLSSSYGRGRLFSLAVPDNFSALSEIPVPVMDMVRRVFASGDIYISGRNVSLFQYDNGVFTLYSYVRDNTTPSHVQIHLLKKPKSLVRLDDGKEIPMKEVLKRHEEWTDTEWVCEIMITPGEFCSFQVIWE